MPCLYSKKCKNFHVITLRFHTTTIYFDITKTCLITLDITNIKNHNYCYKYEDE